ncbi:troponin I 2 isoform X3 [Planococcus citri]|uniref:troponin I 2 isoform X3 n=1 Tax=Planococcus citri TaxID=170843 RepID=UPI0031F87E3C
MADDERKRIEEAKKAKQAEIDRKRAEVRKRMEEASKAKKAKKGFMTPDRKKKLRLLLRKKAAEELKKEQERKAAERRRIIEERCGTPKDVDNASEDLIKRIINDYYQRINKLEEDKFDLEYVVKRKDAEIADLNSQVNDLRGKFVKPTLKKVSKYENKFAKLQKKAAEFNFRNQLKVVKKKEFTLEEEDKEKKPDWSKKGDEKKGEGESEDESCATHDDTATIGDSDHTDLDGKSDAGISEGSLCATPEPILEEPVIEEPEPEPEPPSPAPEELWTYLKEVVTHDTVSSVDDLLEKLVTTVSAIPEPYLKSVVKESIKKQKSIEEDDFHIEGAEGAPAENGDPSAAPAEGAPAEGAGEAPAEGAGEAPAEGAPPTDAPPAAENAPAAEGAESVPAAEPAPAESTPEPAPGEPAPAVEAQPPMVEAAA